MGTATRAVVLAANSHDLEVRDLVLPELGEFMVEVRIRAAGVCGSQLHQIDAPAAHDRLLGHEAFGVVIAVGPRVTHCQVDDAVLLTWVPRVTQFSHREPTAVRVGQVGRGPAVPASSNVFAWASIVHVDEQYLVRVAGAGTAMPDQASAIIGCAVMTGAGAVANAARVLPEDTVAVWGCGGVGLSAVRAAHVRGARMIVAVDQDPAKLELARRFGATHVIDTHAQDPVSTLHELTHKANGGPSRSGGPLQGVRVTIDCIASQWSIERAIKTTVPSSTSAPAGVVVLVGYPPAELRIDGRSLFGSEVSIRTSLGGSGEPDIDLPRYLAWSHTGQLDLEGLVTDRFSLAQINEAVDSLRRRKIRGRAIVVFDE